MNLLLSFLTLHYIILALLRIYLSLLAKDTPFKVSSGHTSQRDFPFFPAHPSVGLLRQPPRGPFIPRYQCSLYVELQYFGAKDQILQNV